MVNVYEHQDNGCDNAIVGRVKYNDRLDYWNGHNWGNGGTGMHKGITRLTKSGRMVIIIGTQWQGCKDAAYCVSDQEAIREILNADKEEIIAEYPQLVKIYNEMDRD